MINVVVTGNAPYRNHKHNTSRMIRDALPDVIKRAGHPDIVILKYNRDSLDIYDDILNMVNEIWKGKRGSFASPPDEEDKRKEVVDITLTLHLGMSSEIPEFRAEKISYRDGYERPGEDGAPVDKDHFKKLGLPESLKPVFDIDDAVATVKDAYPKLPIRSPADSNHGFCEYRLFASLAELLLNHKGKEGRAAFLHVPADKSSEAIKLGADVTAAFIAALVDGDQAND